MQQKQLYKALKTSQTMFSLKLHCIFKTEPSSTLFCLVNAVDPQGLYFLYKGSQSFQWASQVFPLDIKAQIKAQ